MEDTVSVDRRRRQSHEDCVVRQFSPVRIERLLLTRLFDLTTGRDLADADDGSIMTEAGTGVPSLGRREAA